MRVYYVNGYANEVYYVRAEDEKAAEALLRKEIGKYVFKQNLSEVHDIPEKLGDNIIVEFGISKGTLDQDDLRFDDMTATAYVFAANDMPLWKDWDIDMADVVGDENVAKSLEETLIEAEAKVTEDDV